MRFRKCDSLHASGGKRIFLMSPFHHHFDYPWPDGFGDVEVKVN
jgi:hypothetical protein